MTRTRLGNRRIVENFDLVWSNLKFIIDVGRDLGSDTVQEVFITIAKAPGSAIDSSSRDIAVLMSLCLQHGCPASVMADALTKNDDGFSEGLAGAVAEEIVNHV